MINITIPTKDHHVLCGFENGAQMRKRLGLEHFEQHEATIQLSIDHIYTVSSLYLRGLLNSNPSKYVLKATDPRVQHILDLHVHMMNLYPDAKKKTLKMRMSAALRAFRRGF